MAYGYRDDAYFFLKIRQAFPGNAGWTNFCTVSDSPAASQHPTLPDETRHFFNSDPTKPDETRHTRRAQP
jgi:hypothetical protein